jgi:hypothetical protein
MWRALFIQFHVDTARLSIEMMIHNSTTYSLPTNRTKLSQLYNNPAFINDTTVPLAVESAYPAVQKLCGISEHSYCSTERRLLAVKPSEYSHTPFEIRLQVHHAKFPLLY